MEIENSKATLLLHVCCACCATEVYNRLKDEFEVVLFWYNPNIYPFVEYKKRLKSFKKLSKDINCKFICHSESPGDEESSVRVIPQPVSSTERALMLDPLTGSFSSARRAPFGSQDDRMRENVFFQIDNDRWQKATAGLESEPEGGKRCLKCFEFRLEQTAKNAKENNFDIFATTLTISPHKNAAVINSIGKNVGNKYDIKFLESDFKKLDGYKKSVELSHKHNLYRQNYCGCKYSIHN